MSSNNTPVSTSNRMTLRAIWEKFSHDSVNPMNTWYIFISLIYILDIFSDTQIKYFSKVYYLFFIFAHVLTIKPMVSYFPQL